MKARNSREPRITSMRADHAAMVATMTGERAQYPAGYEGLYAASADGRVLSYIPWRGTNFREMSQSANLEGYKRIKAELISKHASPVHRIVSLAFYENPDFLPQVNHRDGDKGNNHFSNLEWCNNAHNQLHASRTGLRIYSNGENHAMAILTEAQAMEIKKSLAAEFYRGQLDDLAVKYGVSKHAIFDIRRRKSWRHLA